MGITTLFQVRDSFRVVLPQWEWLSRACAAFRAVREVQGPVREDIVVYVTWRRLGPSSMLQELLYFASQCGLHVDGVSKLRWLWRLVLWPLCLSARTAAVAWSWLGCLVVVLGHPLWFVTSFQSHGAPAEEYYYCHDCS